MKNAKSKFSTLFVTLLVTLYASSAHAGLIELMQGWTDTFKAGGVFLVSFMFILGVAAGVYSISIMWKMKDPDQRGDESRVKSLVVALLVCSFGLGFGFYLTNIQETVTGNSSNETGSVSASDFGIQ